MKLHIACYRDRVEIEGINIPRPSTIPPSRWYQMWEDDGGPGYDRGFRHGYNIGWNDHANGN